jgi:predicted PurR-regulated permease PerM
VPGGRGGRRGGGVSASLPTMPDPTRPADGPPDWRTLHLWQVQPVRDGLVILGALGLLWLGYRLSVVTVPILLALFLAYLFEPLVGRLTRARWVSRQGAALAIIAAAGLVVVVPVTLAVGFAVLQGVRVAAGVANNAGALIRTMQAESEEERLSALGELAPPWRRAADELRELRREVEEHRRRMPQPGPPADPGAAAPPPVPAWKEELYHGIDLALKWVRANAHTIARSVGETALGGGAQAIQAALAALGSVVRLAFGAFLTAFFFYFFSTGYGQVLGARERLIPERGKGRAIELLGKMDRVIAGFVRGRLVIVAVLSAYLVGAYWLIGVPAPVVLGLSVGVLFLVPFAPALGVPAAWLLMTLEPSAWEFQQGWWWVLLAPVGVYLVAQALDDYVLTPTIQGKATGLETPMIVFASVAGGVLAGVYGLLLAIPVAACLKMLADEVFWPRFRAWAEGKERDVLPIG